MNEKIIDKLGELLQNETIVAAIKGSDADNAVKVLRDNGLEITKEELKEALDYMVSATEDKELTLEEAEAVAGGRLTLKEWWRGVKQVVKGIRDELFDW